jgi:hypothetical protein
MFLHHGIITEKVMLSSVGGHMNYSCCHLLVAM